MEEVPIPIYMQRLKEALQEAYTLVRDKCNTEHRWQIETGNLVWLHSPAVLRGQSQKLHRPWKGPLRDE